MISTMPVAHILLSLTSTNKARSLTLPSSLSLGTMIHSKMITLVQQRYKNFENLQTKNNLNFYTDNPCLIYNL